MLNTLPPSESLPRLPPPITQRRRGGQPSNHKALKHGLFAYKNLTKLTNLSNLIRPSQSGPEDIPDLLSQAIPSLREHIDLLFMSSQGNTDIRTVLSRHRPIIHLLGLFLRIKKSLHRYQQPLLDLQFTAAHTLDLIRWNFHSSGIMRDTDSFREKNKKSDFNSFQEVFFSSISDTPSTFLTSHQWDVLEP